MIKGAGVGISVVGRVVGVSVVGNIDGENLIVPGMTVQTDIITGKVFGLYCLWE